MNTVCSVEELIGHTPLFELQKLAAQSKTGAHVFAKLERFNPGGSAKDRAAKWMLDVAEAQGKLAPGGTIIEPTSGNTGIGLAMIAAVRGYTCIIVMPDTMSVERQQLMSAYGARVVLSPGAQGMEGCIRVANELAAQTPNSFIPDQFANQANAQAHFDSTAPEIWDGLDGAVDAFVAGIGTGGTITGVGRYLKEKNPGVKIFGVEPASSPLITTGKCGAHGIQGIGANFVPDLLDLRVIDQMLTVTNDDAFEMSRNLARTEGLLVGISSGAAVFAAMQVATQTEFAGKNVVVLLPDTGERYLSTGIYAD